jgi:hypothetical protein
MLAETQVNKHGRFWEDWPIEGEFDFQTNKAYIISKFICAKYSIQLFFNEKTGYEMFNVSNPSTFDQREFDEVAAELRVQIEVLEPEEFYEKANKLDKNHEITDFIKMGLIRQRDIEQSENNLTGEMVQWLTGDKNVFISQKLMKYLQPQDNYLNGVQSSEEILKRSPVCKRCWGF